MGARQAGVRCANNWAHHGLGFGQSGFAPRQQAGHGCGEQDPNHKKLNGTTDGHRCTQMKPAHLICVHLWFRSVS